jgi:FdhD protein
MRYAAGVDAPSHDDTDQLVGVPRTQVSDGAVEHGADEVVREEPLELRVGGVPLAVVMRTPGHDEDLAWGFLLTERIVDGVHRVQSVRHCTTVETPEAEDNVMQVVLADDFRVDLARLRRNLYASSSCGICGKATIENVLDAAPALEDETRVHAEVLHRLPDALRAEQDVFDRTGGLHAAGLFTPSGERLCVREDVGRHNAVDKVVGWAARSGLDPRGHVLQVSGRVSYEIMQKALAARIPIVAAVSAPSSLAIELAHAADMTLVAFSRGRRLCIYAGAHRVNS